MKQGRTGASKQSPGSTLEEQNHNGISTVRMCPPFPIRSTTCQGRARRVDLATGITEGTIVRAACQRKSCKSCQCYAIEKRVAY
jgi:hypothetical protein